MTLSLLHHYRGAAVELSINGRPAMGVLNFDEDGGACLSSLCFTQGASECPVFTHVLSSEELETLRRNGPRHLTSSISITHQGDLLAPAGTSDAPHASDSNSSSTV